MENKTTLKGAVIASESGDLKLDTGSLEYSHINDKDRSYSIGGGYSLGSSESTQTYGGVTGDPETSPKYGIDGNYSLSDKRQKNFGTIGEGEIIVRDGNTDLSGLNRDVEIAQYTTKEKTGFEGSFRFDDTTVDMTKVFAGAVSNPEEAWKDLKKMGTDSWDNLGEFVDNVKEAAEKTSNLLAGDGYNTNAEVEIEKEKERQKLAEEEKNKRLAEEAERKKQMVQYQVEGTDITGIRAGGVEDYKEVDLVNQHDIKTSGKNYLCTFTVWFMAAVHFADELIETLSFKDAYEAAKQNGGITDPKGTGAWANAADVSKILKASGVEGIEVSAGYVIGQNNLTQARATQMMVDTLNANGIVHVRVEAPGAKESHSVFLWNYEMHNGNLYFQVKDPNKGEFSYYDPVKGKLFNFVNGDIKPDARSIIRYQTAKKK